MNTEKQLQAVTFEQAKRLKDAGFDWYTRKWYSINGCIESSFYPQIHNEKFKVHETKISAPTVALALKFCIQKIGRKKHIREIDLFSVTEKDLSNILDELLTLLEKEK
jgi:hypothetical protein